MAITAKVPAQRVSGKRVTRVTPETLPSLIDRLTEHIADRYSGLTDDEYLTLAAWIWHTYLYEHSGITVYLHIWSQLPNAGKSALAEILENLCYEAQRIAPTVSALSQFRDIGHTAIVDELDNLISSRNVDLPELNRVLNIGYKPGTLYKVSGSEPRNVFFPKALIGIGPSILQHTVETRSIKVQARPGSAADHAERVRRQALRPVFKSSENLRIFMTGLAAKRNTQNRVKAAMYPLPTFTLTDGTVIFNRDAEIWGALITACDIIGEDYGKRMRDIAARHVGSEPEPVPTMADQIDAGLRKLMREGKLTAFNFRDWKAPLQGKTGYPLSNTDFGYPAPRNGLRGRLPEISLYLKETVKLAELHIRSTDFDEICRAMNMNGRDVKNAYDDAKRLHAQTGHKTIALPMREGQAKPYQAIVAITVSCWLWPDEMETS